MEIKNENLFLSKFRFFKRKVILSFCIASWNEQYVTNYPTDLSALAPLEPQFFISSPEDKITIDDWKARLEVSE
jgi:hypothetical protein